MPIINPDPLPESHGSIPGTLAFSRHATDYAYIHIADMDAVADYARHPLRLSALSVILCLDGEMEVEIDTTPYHVEPNTIIFLSAGSMLDVKEIATPGLEACVLLLSVEFLNSLNLDINVLGSVQFAPDIPRTLQVDKSDMKLLKRYLDLMHLNTTQNQDAIFVRSISRNLFVAALYQTIQLAVKYRGKETVEMAVPGGRVSRCHSYVRNFMNLVHQHHRSQRNVAFYADKLFLSSKYLSHIIKNMTGRSAAEWIDHFVILEAKNLLRYSGKNVQQVAYDLNFPNQSAFGKYFKHITGMSPTEFQRS